MEWNFHYTSDMDLYMSYYPVILTYTDVDLLFRLNRYLFPQITKENPSTQRSILLYSQPTIFLLCDNSHSLLPFQT